MSEKRLSEMKKGETGRVVRIAGAGRVYQRLVDLVLSRGAKWRCR
jgi:Fe2+ transport system protein FeoA